MNDESAVSRLQSVVRASDLDGWLLYDFRGLNPFPAQLLRLGPGILTRRWFLYVPAQGLATLIHHRIEAGSWQHVLPDETIERKVFASHEQLDEVLRETLKGAQRIAMEYRLARRSALCEHRRCRYGGARTRLRRGSHVQR